MEVKFCPEEHPHRRCNPLTGGWVLVSPHRGKRPWLGQMEPLKTEVGHSYDPQCPLCPGNKRAGGEQNKQYVGAYVFNNDFAALRADAPDFESSDPLFRTLAERGEARVICYSSDHAKSLPELSLEEIFGVVQTWGSQSMELGLRYRNVQIFENKGETMGCSMPHPHGQIWAQSSRPSMLLVEDGKQLQYWQSFHQCMLMEYAARELREEKRVVEQNEHWVVLVPYWASWPFETLLLPKQHVARMTELNRDQQFALAEILKNLTIRYDNLFSTSFPYSMGWHSAPYDHQSHPEWLLHAHFYPPLLRSATVKKFMVGYEMLAEAQRDLTPEMAAERLRSQSRRHFSQGIA